MIDVVLNVAVFATSVLCIVAFSAWAQGKKTPTGRSSTSTLSFYDRRVSPKPLTLNRPASNAGCSSGRVSFF